SPRRPPRPTGTGHRVVAVDLYTCAPTSAPAPTPPKKARPLLRIPRWAPLACIVLAVAAAAAGAFVYYTVSSKLPEVQSLRDIERQEPMYVNARDGNPMGLLGEFPAHPR